MLAKSADQSLREACTNSTEKPSGKIRRGRPRTQLYHSFRRGKSVGQALLPFLRLGKEALLRGKHSYLFSV